ncbi:hypothetical protein [Nocardiopsis dassonvillei]|uniref:UDP-N-acetylglucosamine kinase n=1 Tax=Nocardiopsis dassonvillei (strain ATCC 23218 / DSM 43111 / CIP 107115 / JCM 7437 / KCTC 9190 / NBRC 14626 / NCTC 10488 / NRRL B-5397 / IMRU 509) TaxID=446468 RepID=D7AZ46_NOCDD|nr:hypothetical protein [Nocardiopsis dassonvillei]ADH70026.1 conserved hypothetical protein [Nocardiopsis dassonvillei subsp. dassonvillei DSM 43111]VEI90541.1 Uncharacterised protein [Nocardiopsis dassonvillei]
MDDHDGGGSAPGSGSGNDSSGDAGTGRRRLLLIGGGSGTGKTTVGWEVSVILQRRGIAHCVLEGDYMDQVHPAPPGDPRRSGITERNVAAVWANYAALGHHRLVYTNTVSVLEEDMLRRAMGGGDIGVTRILLTAGEATVRARLAVRETGSQLLPHVERSLRAAVRLDAEAPAGTVRVATDGRTVEEVAARVVAATGW